MTADGSALGDARFRCCAVVPTYDNPATIGTVVAHLRHFLETVIVVDDGSGPAGRAACEALRHEAVVLHRAHNGGKGAAVQTGLEEAQRRGFSHVLQVDADGQHHLADVPRFLEAAAATPTTLVLGSPTFDASAPKARRIGRLITTFWVRFESGKAIDDAMCGFRVYPVDATLQLRVRGMAMDYDPEVAVRFAWTGRPILNLPTRVRYLAPAEGGVSHFRGWRDNLLISWLHCRLATTRSVHVCCRLPLRWIARRLAGGRADERRLPSR